MTKKDVAEIFADFVKNHEEYCEKNKGQILDILKEKYKNSNLKKGTLTQICSDISSVTEIFSGKGVYEIGVDLDLMQKHELDDWFLIAERILHVD